MSQAGQTAAIFLRGRRIALRPLMDADFNAQYHGWLNDPEVNAFSQRRPFPQSWEGMRSYPAHYEKNPREGFVLAVEHSESGRHVGNVALVNLQPIHRRAEVAILIGAKDMWNMGIGAEAVYLVTKHAFTEMNLEKMFAGSFNPGFIRCVEKLGWQREGVFKEHIWSGNRYQDQVWLAQFRKDFKVVEEFEPR
jgi:ribosomal-protein-alanine N-acetyltransferase